MWYAVRMGDLDRPGAESRSWRGGTAVTHPMGLHICPLWGRKHSVNKRRGLSIPP
jgi:hypothetical protein